MAKRLLLIDDDEGNRLTLGFMLEDEGFIVETAQSFATGKAAVEGAEFDVFIVDNKLGDGMGTDLVPIIRTRSPKARIAMLSGDALGSLAVDLVLTKGMDPDVLLTAVKKLAHSE